MVVGAVVVPTCQEDRAQAVLSVLTETVTVLEGEQRWTVLCLLGECLKEDRWNRSLMMVEAVADFYLQEWTLLSSSSSRSSGNFLATLIGSTLFLRSLSAMTDSLSVSLQQKAATLSHWVLFPTYHLYQTIQSSSTSSSSSTSTVAPTSTNSSNSSGFVRCRRGGTSSSTATPSSSSSTTATTEVIGQACSAELRSFKGILAQPGEESTVVHAGLVLISWFSSCHVEGLVKDLTSMLIDISKHKEHLVIRLTLFSNLSTIVPSFIEKEKTLSSLVIRIITLLCNNAMYSGVMVTSPLVAAACNHSLQVLLKANCLSDQMKGRAMKILQNNMEENKRYFIFTKEGRSNWEEVMKSLQEKLMREVRSNEEYM